MAGESNNPFLNQNYSVETTHNYTKGDASMFPYKTLNRLLDDIKWCLAYRLHCANRSIIQQKPHDYAIELSRLARSGVVKPQMIILNNEMPFLKTRDVLELNEANENQSLTTLRGLLIMSEVNHFRIQILENRSPFFNAAAGINKYSYHVVPKDFLSADDLKKFTDSDYPSQPNNLLEEVFFSSSNADSNQLLRVCIYTSEFTPKELDSLTSSNVIKERYLKESQNNPNLNPETIPNGLQCIQKLINVLKGPILLEEDAPAKTINLHKTSLAATVDIDLLLTKLGFILDEEKHLLIPPTVNKLPGIKESFQRKILELIFVGKGLKVEHNDFNVSYSFSDKLALVYSTFNEVDKTICQTYGSVHESNKYSSFIALSCCTFFQDELIIRCFENTIKSDPQNQLTYVDYLYDIVDHKPNSHKMRSYIHNQNRKGLLFGFSDYIKYLSDLSIKPSPDQTKEEILAIDDSYIISVYQSSIQKDAKNYAYFNKILKTIGMIKNSDVILNFLQEELIPVNLALSDLGVEEITEDEVIITAYEFKLSELTGTDEIATLQRSLYSVAVHRKSFILMNYIEQNLGNLLGKFNHPLPPSKCYEVLDVNENSTEFEIVEKVKSKYLSTDIRLLRQALRSLDSKIIANYLQTGKIDTSLLPAENWPAGLDNIGNTCYLNSLLQYYFSIKPLRDMVLEFEEHDISMMDASERKIGGRKIDINETKRANQFIYHLQRLFDEMIHTNSRCVRPSKDLAYLSFLPSSQQVNFVTVPPRKSIGNRSDPIIVDDDEAEEKEASAPKDGEDMAVDPIVTEETKDDSESVEEIDNPFLSDNAMDTTSINEPKEYSSPPSESEDPIPINEPKTKILPINTLEMETTIELGRQQDVTECIENVNFQIETALDPETIDEDGEQYDLIKKLFYGKIKQTITPLDKKSKENVRSSVERFSSLIINISDHPKDIYDALDNYFNADIIELEEGSVKKTLTISQLPDILQFQIQRVLFDRERLMAYKSIEPIPFGEKLYLDRYLDTDDKDILDKREEVFEWKNQIRTLKETKSEILKMDEESKLNIVDALSATKKYLESIQEKAKEREVESQEVSPAAAVSDSTIEHLDSEISRLKNQIYEIDSTISEVESKISGQFENYKKVAYSIFAVFIHRGEANYGHYWIYIRDPHQKNVFRKYNDEVVSEVPDTEVFNFVEGNTTTPYYIAYVREELEMDYVEPLKRIIRCS